MPPLPDKLIIGAIQYEVTPVRNLHQDGKSLYGEISYSDFEIRIDDRFVNNQRTPFIIWHEIVHGILEQAGLDDTDEKIVSVLGYGIVDALRRNPDLIHLINFLDKHAV